MQDTQSIASNVLPTPAGSTNEAWTDGTIDAVLDYLAFWITHTIAAKVAQLGSPVVVPVADVCPTANRHPFDPALLQPTSLRRPALFVWWDGPSQVAQKTLIFTHRVRRLKALYIYDVVKTGAQLTMRGLVAAVDGAFQLAAERGCHASYEGGQRIVDLASLVRLDYLGGREGLLKDVLSESARLGVEDVTVSRGGVLDGAIQRGYPALEATFEVEERIGPYDSDGGDVKDIDVHIETNENGDMTDTVEVEERILPHDDGAPVDDE